MHSPKWPSFFAANVWQVPGHEPTENAARRDGIVIYAESGAAGLAVGFDRSGDTNGLVFNLPSWAQGILAGDPPVKAETSQAHDSDVCGRIRWRNRGQAPSVSGSDHGRRASEPKPYPG